jgi:hypothetical protein
MYGGVLILLVPSLLVGEIQRLKDGLKSWGCARIV